MGTECRPWRLCKTLSSEFHTVMTVPHQWATMIKVALLLLCVFACQVSLQDFVSDARIDSKWKWQHELGGDGGSCHNKWCNEAQKKYGVKPDSSWGSMPESLRPKWTENHCENAIAQDNAGCKNRNSKNSTRQWYYDVKNRRSRCWAGK